MFISPQILPDSHGTAISYATAISSTTEDAAIPPGYGAHILDQLYEDINGCYDGETQLQQGSLPGSATQSMANSDDSDSGESYDLTRLPTYNTAARSSLVSHTPSGNPVLPGYSAVE